MAVNVGVNVGGDEQPPPERVRVVPGGMVAYRPAELIEPMIDPDGMLPPVGVIVNVAGRPTPPLTFVATVKTCEVFVQPEPCETVVAPVNVEYAPKSA